MRGSSHRRQRPLRQEDVLRPCSPTRTSKGRLSRCGSAAGELLQGHRAVHVDRFQFVRGRYLATGRRHGRRFYHDVDRIVNWAMILSKDPNPRLNTKVGLLGACNVWEAARLLGIKRVVYASSETVYGEQKDYGDIDIHEDVRLLPFTGSFYALSKCLAEIMADQYHELLRHRVDGPAAGHRIWPWRQGSEVRALVLGDRVAARRSANRPISSAPATGSSR